jgi:hypothetical protein
MAAVLYAVRPKEGYFQLSGPGMITVLDDARTKFTATPEGKHQYLILDPAQKDRVDRVIKTYTEIASAKPVPRQPRFRPQDKKNEPAKPPEAKPQVPPQ